MIIIIHVQCPCTCTMYYNDYYTVYIILCTNIVTEYTCTMVSLWNNRTCIIITLYMYVRVVWNKLVM